MRICYCSPTSHKTDAIVVPAGVMMAARSLIQLFRAVNPALLHKKDRVRKLFGCRGGWGGGGEKRGAPHP